MTLGDKKKDSFEVNPLYKVIGILIFIIILGTILLNMSNEDEIVSNKTEIMGNNTTEIPTETSQKNKTEDEIDKTDKTDNNSIQQETENEPSKKDSEINIIEDSTHTAKIQELIDDLRTYNESIFDIYDITQDEKEIRNLISIVNDECRDNETHELDISCSIISIVWNSKNSDVCDFNCLPSFCEIYKMHAAVYVLNQMLPDKEIFIAMDAKGRMYVLYKENEKWKTYGVNPMNVDLNKTIVLYNDEYSSENKFDIIEPRYVKRGGKFCFEIYANESCTCKIEQQELNVGKCPQLSTKMFLSLCEKPIETFELLPGNNKFCFEIPKDYKKGLYTYSFVFVSDKKYLGVGNSIIEVSRHNCCVEGTELRGFVVVR